MAVDGLLILEGEFGARVNVGLLGTHLLSILAGGWNCEIRDSAGTKLGRRFIDSRQVGDVAIVPDSEGSLVGVNNLEGYSMYVVVFDARKARRCGSLVGFRVFTSAMREETFKLSASLLRQYNIREGARALLSLGYGLARLVGEGRPDTGLAVQALDREIGQHIKFVEEMEAEELKLVFQLREIALGLTGMQP